MMQVAFLASPPLKNHLQHNLKKPSIRPPSSPSMCRVYVHLLRATPPRPSNYSPRSPGTTQLAPSTKAGFRNRALCSKKFLLLMNFESQEAKRKAAPKKFTLCTLGLGSSNCFRTVARTHSSTGWAFALRKGTAAARSRTSFAGYLFRIGSGAPP